MASILDRPGRAAATTTLTSERSFRCRLSVDANARRAGGSR